MRFHKNILKNFVTITMVTKSRKIKRGASRQTLIYSLVLLLLFSVAIGFLVYSNWRINKRRAELVSKIQHLQQEIQVAEKKNQELKSGISESLSPSYLEERARSDLGLKKPGEEVVVVLPPPEKEKETKKEERGIWRRILEKVKIW